MRDWPDWLEGLRPDEVTSARLRRSVAEAARPLLEARREDWWDVAAGWAGLLTPVAAMLVLVFAGLATQQMAGEEALVADGLEATPDVVEALRSEAAPAGFSEVATSDDLVFAALGEAARLRPASAPVRSPGGARP